MFDAYGWFSAGMIAGILYTAASLTGSPTTYPRRNDGVASHPRHPHRCRCLHRGESLAAPTPLVPGARRPAPPQGRSRLHRLRHRRSLFATALILTL